MRLTTVRKFFLNILVKAIFVWCSPSCSLGLELYEKKQILLLSTAAVLCLRTVHQDYQGSLLSDTRNHESISTFQIDTDLDTEQPGNNLYSGLAMRLSHQYEISLALTLYGHGALHLLEQQGVTLPELYNLDVEELRRIANQLWGGLDQIKTISDHELFSDLETMTPESMQLRIAALHLAETQYRALETYFHVREESLTTLGVILQNRLEVLLADILDGYWLLDQKRYDSFTIYSFNHEELSDEEVESTIENQSLEQLNNYGYGVDLTNREKAYQMLWFYIRRFNLLHKSKHRYETSNPNATLARIVVDRISLVIADSRQWFSIIMTNEKQTPNSKENNTQKSSSTHHAVSHSFMEVTTTSKTETKDTRHALVGHGNDPPEDDYNIVHSLDLHCAICQGHCQEIIPATKVTSVELGDDCDLECDSELPSLQNELSKINLNNPTAEVFKKEKEAIRLPIPNLMARCNQTLGSMAEYQPQVDRMHEMEYSNQVAINTFELPRNIPFFEGEPQELTTSESGCELSSMDTMDLSECNQSDQSEDMTEPVSCDYWHQIYFVVKLLHDWNTKALSDPQIGQCPIETSYDQITIWEIPVQSGQVVSVTLPWSELVIKSLVSEAIQAYRTKIRSDSAVITTGELDFLQYVSRIFYVLYSIQDYTLNDSFFKMINEQWGLDCITNKDLIKDIYKIIWKSEFEENEDECNEIECYEVLCKDELFSALRDDLYEKFVCFVNHFYMKDRVFSNLASKDGLNIYQQIAKQNKIRELKYLCKTLSSKKFSEEVNQIKSFTCLSYTVSNHSLNMLKFLVEAGVDVNVQDDHSGKFTVLMEAIKNEKTDFICYLLTLDQLDLNVRDIKGNNAIYFLNKFLSRIPESDKMLKHFLANCAVKNKVYLQKLILVEAKNNKNSLNPTFNLGTPTTKHLYQAIIKVVRDQSSPIQNRSININQFDIEPMARMETDFPYETNAMSEDCKSCELHNPERKAMELYWGDKYNEKDRLSLLTAKHDSLIFHAILPNKYATHDFFQKFINCFFRYLNSDIGNFNSIKSFQLIQYLNSRYKDHGDNLFTFVGGVVRNSLEFASTGYEDSTDIDIQTTLLMPELQDAMFNHLRKRYKVEYIKKNIMLKGTRLITLGDILSHKHIDFYSTNLCTPEHGRFCDFTINYSFVILTSEGEFILVTRDSNSIADITNKHLYFNKNVFDLYNEIKVNPNYLLRYLNFISRGYKDKTFDDPLYRVVVWNGIKTALIAVMIDSKPGADLLFGQKEFNVISDGYSHHETAADGQPENELIKLDFLYFPQPNTYTIWMINYALSSNIGVRYDLAYFFVKLHSGQSLSDKHENDNARFAHFAKTVKNTISKCSNQLTLKDLARETFSVSSEFKNFPYGTKTFRSQLVTLSTPHDLLHSSVLWNSRQSKKNSSEGIFAVIDQFGNTSPCARHFSQVVSLWSRLVKAASITSSSNLQFYTTPVAQMTQEIISSWLSYPYEDPSYLPHNSGPCAHQYVESVLSLFFVIFAELQKGNQYAICDKIQSGWNEIEELLYRDKMTDSDYKHKVSRIINYADVILKFEKHLSIDVISRLKKLIVKIKDS